MNINDILIKITIFTIITILGLIVSKVVYNLTKKAIKELELNAIFKKADINFNPNNFLPSLLKYIIYLITIITALRAIGIIKTVTIIITTILLLTLIAYILISVKDLIPNWYYGLKIKKKCKIGNTINYNKINGKIKKIGLFELQVNEKGRLIHLPYKILKKKIK